MAKQHRILTGQVAAITGAARGIGRATAQAFLREGMKVAIGDLDFATAQKTAKELGHGTVAFEVDLLLHRELSWNSDVENVDPLVARSGDPHFSLRRDQGDAVGPRVQLQACADREERQRKGFHHHRRVN